MELNKLCPRPNSLYAFFEAINLQREYSVLVVCGLILRRWYPDQWTGVKRRVRGALKLLALPFSYILHRLGDLTHQFGTSSEVS